MSFHKTLIVVRHSKAETAANGQKDIERILNEKGLNEASQMGNRLFQMELCIDAIVTSPANRAHQTATLIAIQLNLEKKMIIISPNIYNASVRVLLNEICALNDAYQTVVLCGHNPDLSYLAEKMTNQEIGELPTCAMIGIRFDTDSWKKISSDTIGQLLFNIRPE